MKSIKIRIQGMHCEACEKNLKRAIGQFNHVHNINLKYTDENVEIFYNPELNINEVFSVIKNLGYNPSLIKDELKKLKFNNFVNEILYGKNIEKEMLILFFNTLIVLSLVEIISYFGFFTNVPDFFSKYVFYLIFLVLSVVLTATSIWHIKAYGNDYSCMSGMMVGMTIGMISGFLIGTIVGATNGMFIGSIVGLLSGVIVGSWCGSCTGIMGIMEGMMAGLMGGLMGAMTSLMLINDNLKIMILILFIISALILLGLDYMIYKENNTREINIKYNKFNFISFCFAVTITITFIMVYGPKSVLFR